MQVPWRVPLMGLGIFVESQTPIVMRGMPPAYAWRKCGDPGDPPISGPMLAK